MNEIMKTRPGNPAWVKGVSGNLAGRPVGTVGAPHRQLAEFRQSYYEAWAANRLAFEAGLAREIKDRPLEFARVFGSLFPRELLLSVQAEERPAMDNETRAKLVAMLGDWDSFQAWRSAKVIEAEPLEPGKEGD